MAAIDQMLCQVAEHFCVSGLGPEKRFILVRKKLKATYYKNMKKVLCEKAGISPVPITKLVKNRRYYNVDSCKTSAALVRSIENLMDIVPEESEFGFSAR